MLILVDTNILLRLADSSHARNPVAVKAVDALRAGKHDLVIVPQVLYEFWSVTTRTIAANGLGKSPEFAEKFIESLCDTFRLLRDERAIYETWFQLVAAHGIQGVKSFDTRLVAAMSRHKIAHILTFDSRDFSPYDDIIVLLPDQIIQEYENDPSFLPPAPENSN